MRGHAATAAALASDVHRKGFPISHTFRPDALLGFLSDAVDVLERVFST